MSRVIASIVLLSIIFISLFVSRGSFQKNENRSKDKFGQIINQTPPPTPIPTPKPLTFAEMNALYGPCTRLPVLMYHHIQSKESAVAKKQTSLTVETDLFKSQMTYLKDKGYNVAIVQDIINFFDNSTPIPQKSVLITFDDGYGDIYSDAYPVLSGLGYHATVFVPTGLMGNPDYLTWDQISEMKGLILFANHTWAHKNVQGDVSEMQTEIKTADTQLSDHGLNIPKAFAYPYGLKSPATESYLALQGFKVAFTTVPGSILCEKQRLSLPRIRIGNRELSSYGL